MKWLTHESAEGLLAINSLARSLSGDARLADVGGLLWMILRQSVPCDAMAIFLIDDDRGHVAVRFAAGHHADAVRHVTRPIGTGIAGAVAVHWKPMVNGDPAFDLGRCAIDRPPAALVPGDAAGRRRIADRDPRGLQRRAGGVFAGSRAAARAGRGAACRVADRPGDHGRGPAAVAGAALPALQLVKAQAMPEAPRPDPPAARAARAPRMQAERRRAALPLPLSMTTGPTG